MTDWTYIVGETSYNQDFRIINQDTNEVIQLGGTITMFITSSDFVTPFPASGDGVAMSIVTVDNEPAARLGVISMNMPQTPGIFLAQIKIEDTQTFKTFLLNLRVIRSITN